MREDRSKVAIMAPANDPFDVHEGEGLFDFGTAGEIAPELASRKGSLRKLTPPTMEL